jgi:hypothetical protein
MSDRSIEFQEIKEDTALPKIIRKSFRVPIEEHENVWVAINKQRYPVLDIGLDGVGISLEKDLMFTIEQAILNCELNIYDVSMKELSGQIVHLTACGDEKWQCGIRWINLEKKTADKIFGIVSKMKDQLLKDERISYDE